MFSQAVTHTTDQLGQHNALNLMGITSTNGPLAYQMLTSDKNREENMNAKATLLSIVIINVKWKYIANAMVM